MIVTHASLNDIDNLTDIFAVMVEGGAWALPEWLLQWKERLEAENVARWKAWPFAHEVIPRQVGTQELIDRQYAHFTNPISGLKAKT